MCVFQFRLSEGYTPSSGIAGSHGTSLLVRVVHTGVPCPKGRRKPQRNNTEKGQEDSHQHQDKPQAGLSLGWGRGVGGAL